MSTHVVDRVDSWDERSFDGGYRALHDLAEESFSGVVRAGGAELYMTRGVVVGVRMGEIEDFEAATGTVYEAPAEALPLLAVMQERSDEVKAKYYSEDTSIATVDDTLSDGGFTGFIELSENVLSGDYYLVYHAGTSMAVAFVGESERLIDSDEAFETANDEVGIYEVRPVDVEPIEIPEPETPEPDAAGGDGADDGDTEPEQSQPTAEPEDSNSASESDSSPAGTGTTGAATGAAGAAATGEPPADSTAADDTASGRASEGSTGSQTAADATAEESATARSTAAGTGDRTGAERSESADERTPDQSSKEPAARSQTASTQAAETRTDERAGETGRSEPTTTANGAAVDSNAGATERRTAEKSATDDREPTASPTGGRSAGARDGHAGGQPQRTQSGGGARRASAGAAGQDLETRAIPSLDPDQTSIPDTDSEPTPPTPDGTAGTSRTTPEQTSGQSRDEPSRQTQTTATGGESTPTAGQPAPASEAPQEPAPTPDNGRTRPDNQEAGEPEARKQQHQPEQSQQPPAEEGPSERVSELEAELDAKEEEIERLESELSEATEQREELEQQLADLEAERDDLAAEVEQLEEELARLEEEFGAATNADTRLTPAEALSGTDIFVRYHSKGKATLEKAHNGSPRRDDVNENLRLEKHTQFDDASASVGGQSYAEFLETTLEYQFVQWVVRELLFEIRDTGHEKGLGDLYDVLPKIDRAELSGVIRVTYTEDGQQTQAEERFDVVLRDRMGNPLLVANLNDTREATTESMMEGLITSAERVGQSVDTFGGAFYVTESFFDPSALEIADEATRGGLLSRDKRKSFVNLSRKRGYHLCLVEARNENFHLAVPEL